MSNLNLLSEYTDQAINIRNIERVNACLEDHKLDPTDKDNMWFLSKETRYSLQEQLRKEYCVQIALRNDDKKMLKQLLNP